LALAGAAGITGSVRERFAQLRQVLRNIKPVLGGSRSDEFVDAANLAMIPWILRRRRGEP
jgi:hypothetical protein